ncbi:MAG: OmpA family protein [Nitrospiraceae bacterium]
MKTVRSHRWLLLYGLLVLIMGVGCATRSGSGSGQEKGGEPAAAEQEVMNAEQVAEPALKDVPFEAAQKAAPLPPEPAEPTTAYLLDVPFDFDRYVLRMDAVAIVETNAKNLSKDTVSQIVLEGRADEIGTAAYNMVLGERRAKTVKRYLEDLGFSSSILSIVTYGKDRPLCFEHSPECWQKNRSVRFTVK